VLIARRLLEVCWTFAGSCKHPITQAMNVTETISRTDARQFKTFTNN